MEAASQYCVHLRQPQYSLAQIYLEDKKNITNELFVGGGRLKQITLNAQYLIKIISLLWTGKWDSDII